MNRAGLWEEWTNLLSPKTLPCFPCAMGSEVHFLSGFHLVFHCMLLHWNNNHQLRIGNMLKDTSQPLFWCSQAASDAALYCHENLQWCGADHTSAKAPFTAWVCPTNPWVHPHPTSGTGAPTSPVPPRESNPSHVVFKQRRTETRMFWRES